MSAHRNTHGFTLLEVLIALAVVALAMLALSRTAAIQVGAFDALRERTMAGWVAANVLAETRLAGTLPSTGRSDGHVELAAHRWRWTRDVSATPDAQIRRIDIQVFEGESTAPSASVSGFGSAVPTP